jgi:hypothetical protein
MEYEYDELNRLIKQVNYLDDVEVNGQFDAGDDTLLGQYEYELDVFSKRTGLSETDANGVESRADWLYDGLGRLAAERYDFNTSITNGDDYEATYRFDLVANYVKKEVDWSLDDLVDEVFAYGYDRNDRLYIETLDDMSEGDPESIEKITTYEYGDNAVLGSDAGSGTQQTRKTAWEGTDTTGTGTKLSETTYEYNLRGRMSKVIVDADGDGVNPATSTEYKYDDDGIKVSETDVATGGVTTYLIDAANLTGYAKAIEERIDSVLSRSYTIGLQIIDQATAGTTPEVRYFVLDGHSRTRALVDETGAAIEVYRFDAYGEALGFDPAAAGTNWLTGDGRYNPASGLTDHLARWRDGHRFLTLDPFAGNSDDPLSLHKYLYAHATPINGGGSDGRGFGFLSYLQRNGASAKAGLATLDSLGRLQDVIELDKAIKNGRLYGIVTKTSVDFARGAVSEPEFVVKHWDMIGKSTF